MTTETAEETRFMLALLEAQLPPGVWVERGGTGTLHIPLPGRGPGSGRWIELQQVELDIPERSWAARGPGWEGRVWPEGKVEVGPSWEVASWAVGWAGRRS